MSVAAIQTEDQRYRKSFMQGGKIMNMINSNWIIFCFLSFFLSSCQDYDTVQEDSANSSLGMKSLVEEQKAIKDYEKIRRNINLTKSSIITNLEIPFLVKRTRHHEEWDFKVGNNCEDEYCSVG